MLQRGKFRISENMLKRVNALVFYLLFVIAIGLMGWLSNRYEIQWDWTAEGRNSLSEPSRSVLKRLEGMLKIKAFAQENPLLREPIRELIERYQRYSNKVHFEFINPDLEPEMTRRLGITVAGQLLLEYQGRSESLTNIGEEALTNTIQRLALGGERWVGYLTGHGERTLNGRTNHDLGSFGAELERKGYQVRPINLTENPDIPINISLLVIAGPQTDLFSGEIELLKQYIAAGRSLLWLIDPGKQHGLEALAKELGMTILPGTIVDVNAYSLGIKDPAVALITAYPDHPAVGRIDQVTLFPHAAALAVEAPEGWTGLKLLETQPRTWNETGPIKGKIQPDADIGEVAGPLSLAYLLERNVKNRPQRVMVIGDGDFLSNAYLGNGGNLNLGINLVRWLSGDDKLLDIPAKTAPDLTLELSRTWAAILTLGFLVLLPLLLFGSGIAIWWRRRNR